MTFRGRAKSSCFWCFWAEKRDFLMRIMQFCIVLSMGSRFSGLGSFWVSFGVSQEPLLEPGGTHPGFSWVSLPLFWVSCDANLGISWATLSPLGSDFASFGYLVCELSFLPYLWMPLVEFVGIGEAGLDLCQCVSIGAQLHTKPNAHTCATYLYMCTCWSIIWHARLLQQTIENY